MNDGLEAALPKGAGKPFEDELREKFGSQVRVDHGMVKFNESLISDILNGKAKYRQHLEKENTILDFWKRLKTRNCGMKSRENHLQ